MLALGGDDDDPRLGVIGDLVYRLRQLSPEIRGHRIGLVGPVEADVGDVVGDPDAEAGMGHGQLLLSRPYRAFAAQARCEHISSDDQEPLEFIEQG